MARLRCSSTFGVAGRMPRFGRLRRGRRPRRCPLGGQSRGRSPTKALLHWGLVVAALDMSPTRPPGLSARPMPAGSGWSMRGGRISRWGISRWGISRWGRPQPRRGGALCRAASPAAADRATADTRPGRAGNHLRAELDHEHRAHRRRSRRARLRDHPTPPLGCRPGAGPRGRSYWQACSPPCGCWFSAWPGAGGGRTVARGRCRCRGRCDRRRRPSAMVAADPADSAAAAPASRATAGRPSSAPVHPMSFQLGRHFEAAASRGTARIALLHPSALRWLMLLGIAAGSWALDFTGLAARAAAMLPTGPWAGVIIGLWCASGIAGQRARGDRAGAVGGRRAGHIVTARLALLQGPERRVAPSRGQPPLPEPVPTGE
jgi:hypothetical protein